MAHSLVRYITHELVLALTDTVLAPNDAAIQALVTQQPNIDQEDALIRALIQYHVVNDTHPSATFGIEPLFPATLLSNPVYSNVTGGQRVELTSVNGKPTILSGVKAASHVVHAVSPTHAVSKDKVLTGGRMSSSSED